MSAMDGRDIIADYETLARVTAQMLDAARAGDWDHLVQLESACANRVQAMRQAAPAALSGAGRDRKLTLIRQILEHDRQIRDLVTPWMAELSRLLKSHGTQRRLTHAYGA